MLAHVSIALTPRIAGLLHPRGEIVGRIANPSSISCTRPWPNRAMLAGLALVVAAASAGLGPQDGSGRLSANASPQPPSKITPAAAPAADAVVRELAARSASWVEPPAALETLEYEFILGSEVIPVKVTRGERRRIGVWMGATLHTGFHELVRTPEKFDIQVKRQADARTLTLRAKVKDGKGNVRVEAGNGVENSWLGYFAHLASESTIVVDAERLVPLEERTGPTAIRYSDWQEITAGRWIPRQVDVVGSGAHYRMHFAWLGDAVWLLRSSQSISPDGTFTMSRSRNAKVNGRAVAAPASDAERRSTDVARGLLDMLDHNRPWLDAGPTGSGWRPPFRTLAYTFHTVREDVRETCVLDRNGEAVFEVSHDGRGKMKDQVGNRKMTLATPETASSQRGARFARVHGRRGARSRPTFRPRPQAVRPHRMSVGPAAVPLSRPARLVCNHV